MNRARPMAARLKKKPRADYEPRSAHGRAVNKPRVDYVPRSAHGRAVNKLVQHFVTSGLFEVFLFISSSRKHPFVSFVLHFI